MSLKAKRQFILRFVMNSQPSHYQSDERPRVEAKPQLNVADVNILNITLNAAVRTADADEYKTHIVQQ